jgi:hypothetical protein
MVVKGWMDTALQFIAARVIPLKERWILEVLKASSYLTHHLTEASCRHLLLRQLRIDFML